MGKGELHFLNIATHFFPPIVSCHLLDNTLAGHKLWSLKCYKPNKYANNLTTIECTRLIWGHNIPPWSIGDVWLTLWWHSLCSLIQIVFFSICGSYHFGQIGLIDTRAWFGRATCKLVKTRMIYTFLGDAFHFLALMCRPNVILNLGTLQVMRRNATRRLFNLWIITQKNLWGPNRVGNVKDLYDLPHFISQILIWGCLFCSSNNYSKLSLFGNPSRIFICLHFVCSIMEGG